MTSEENKKLVQDYYAAYNNNDLDLAAGFANEDVVVSVIPLQQTFNGIASFKKYLMLLKHASQDAKVSLTNQIANDTNVANEFVFTGTQTGALASNQGEIAATGNLIDLQACDFWEIKEGRISSIRTYFDGAILLKQLGLSSFDQESK